MILLAEKKMQIDQSSEHIFAYVTNMENYGDWFPGVVSVKSFNDLPHATVGKRYQELLVLPEGEVNLVIEVKDCEKNIRFYTEGDLTPLLPAMLMEFTSLAPDKTEFNLRYFTRNTDLEPTDELIESLRLNLLGRIHDAETNLKQHFKS